MVIEDPGDIGVGLVEGGSQLELNRYPCLHVDGSATPEHLLALHRQQLHRQVVCNRHGVYVPGNNHAGGVTKVGAGNDCVAVANDLEVRILGQGRFDCVGELFFVARNRLDVANRSSQLDKIAFKI